MSPALEEAPAEGTGGRACTAEYERFIRRLTFGALGHVCVTVSCLRSDLTGGENEKLVNAAGRV